MALILAVRDKYPKFGKDCFFAENATIVGDVEMGDHCSVWFNAVVRGDVHFIRIGDQTNIQDGAVIHCTYEKAPTIIGNRVSIAHNAVVHGCTLEDRVLVGMGAIVMDHAIVRSGSVIAAGAVVLKNTVIDSGNIYGGVPARKIGEVDPDMQNDFDKTAINYMQYAEWYK